MPKASEHVPAVVVLQLDMHPKDLRKIQCKAELMKIRMVLVVVFGQEGIVDLDVLLNKPLSQVIIRRSKVVSKDLVHPRFID